jgi:succinate dehydrogenase/fumarate reductase flavoprotein subunit
VREGRDVAQLLTVPLVEGGQRVAGALATLEDGSTEVYIAENVVLAVGGPGGLYKTSVYPEVHTGAIGLALMAGARAQSLPESQFGLASIDYRWNVSGTYMQVIPRLISTSAGGGANGDGPDEREFLRETFGTPGEMNSQLFLKGYQWPFDARKAAGGSSLIDILVYIETVIKGRKVYLDYRSDPEGFTFNDLTREAREYLVRSQALLETPIERLRRMNPAAVDLYAEHGIDLARQPLQIAVCAQHNNGGLAGNAWYESANLAHLFAVGEVNGSHGVYRPGGSALNAGQVGAFRAAEYIARRYGHWTLSTDRATQVAQTAVEEQSAWLAHSARTGSGAETSWQVERDELQARMTRAGAHIRSAETLQKASVEAWDQWARVWENGCSYRGPDQAGEALRTRQLCFAHAVYLDAISFAVQSGVGSRGSAIVLDPGGTRIHETLGNEWRLTSEDPAFREQVLETALVELDLAAPRLAHTWVPRRPLPETDAWFETAWARYREGEIYD